MSTLALSTQTSKPKPSWVSEVHLIRPTPSALVNLRLPFAALLCCRLARLEPVCRRDAPNDVAACLPTRLPCPLALPRTAPSRPVLPGGAHASLRRSCVAQRDPTLACPPARLPAHPPACMQTARGEGCHPHGAGVGVGGGRWGVGTAIHWLGRPAPTCLLWPGSCIKAQVDVRWPLLATLLQAARSCFPGFSSLALPPPHPEV